MKRQEMEVKKMMVIISVLVLVLGFALTPAKSELVGALSYYGPKFGEINEYLKQNKDAKLEFKVGIMDGLALGYEINPPFRLRLEYHGFKSKTNGGYLVDLGNGLMRYREEYWKLTILSVIFSGTYKFSRIPLYIGAGIGLYPTVVKCSYFNEQYLNGIFESRQDGFIYDYSKPIGLVMIVGFESENKPIILNIEARYIVSTKAKLGNFGTEIDLSGLQITLLVGFKL